MSDPTDPDPGWEKWLRPNFKKVVNALAQLDDNAVFDKLLAGELLTFSHYEEILRQRKASSSIEDIVRNALLRVVKKPAPAFDDFCRVLRSEMEKTKLELPETETRPASLATDERAETRNSDASRAATASLVEYSDSDSTTGDQETDLKRKIIWIIVIDDLRSQYERQRSVIRAVIKEIAKLPCEHFEFREAYVDELNEIAPVTFDRNVLFRIVFPELSGKEDFKRHYDEIKKIITVHLGNSISKNEIEIVPKDGSCILEITVPGEAFINFVVSLAYPDSLKFLLSVGGPVEIKIGNLERISLDELKRVSFSRLCHCSLLSERLELCKAIFYCIGNEH